jgi:hypothetical protein
MANEIGKIVKAVERAEKKTRRPIKVLSGGVDDVLNVLGLQKGGTVSGNRVQRARPSGRSHRVVKARRR